MPWGLRPAAADAVLLALIAWFGVELVTGAGQVGLAERVAASRRRCGRWRWCSAAAARSGRR